jgi:hypothetical protein
MAPFEEPLLPLLLLLLLLLLGLLRGHAPPRQKGLYWEKGKAS